MRRHSLTTLIALATAMALADAGAPARAVTAPTGPVLPLPAPAIAGILPGVNLGLPPDRLLISKVPGSIHDDEQVLLSLAGDGSPATVAVEQRLSISGTGDYVVRERGPARAAVPIGDGPPPVLQRGTVVWQGFSPGRRDLAARLTLDPGLEATRLPISVSLTFAPASGGAAVPLGVGGSLPGAGVVTVALKNLASRQLDLPTGDADPAVLATSLDRLVAAATHPGTRPPIAGVDLPTAIPAVTVGPALSSLVRLPLHVSGALSVEGATAEYDGPGLTVAGQVAKVSGVLTDAVTFSVHVAGPSRLVLSLDARPGLDGRALKPPTDLPSWAAWARTRPSPSSRASAVSLLMSSAAQSTIATDFAPYLSANLTGVVTSGFHLQLSTVAPTPKAAKSLSPRPVPIAIVVVGLLVIGWGLDRLRRRI